MLDIARSFKVIIGQISESEIHQRDLINFSIFFFFEQEKNTTKQRSEKEDDPQNIHAQYKRVIGIHFGFYNKLIRVSSLFTCFIA